MPQKDAHSLRIPIATYRLQINPLFPFSAAREIVPYLSELGISDCYISPITQAVRGSLHGYDVVQYDQISAELGGREGLKRWAGILQKWNIGLIVDFVPNHMNNSSPENLWWKDVLTYGPASPYAPFFDIDWDSPNPLLKGKILIPLLAKVQHRALEEGDIDLVYDQGMFFIAYYDRWLPVNPSTWPMILQPVFEILKDKISVPSMPSTPEALDRLHRKSRDFRHVLDQVIQEWNGVPGKTGSFRNLKKMMQSQSYRLSFWRMAYEHMNYRRFFDINELVCLRQENLSAFHAVHAGVLDWMEKGWITGLRIDHIDGISDPKQYLERLNKAVKSRLGKSCFLVVEKILSEDEPLPKDWPIQGTTGYDFLNLLNGLFVQSEHRDAIEEIYQEFTGNPHGAQEALYRSKEIVLHTLFRGEITKLAHTFVQAMKEAEERDEFAIEPVEDVIREILASFRVYRTYIRPAKRWISARDQSLLHEAMTKAKAIRSDLPHDLFSRMWDLFTFQIKDAGGGASPAHQEFIRRFQQISGSIMAKGVEDTAFYRRYPLSSLNEVGAELGHFGVSRVLFHEKNLERQRDWPLSLLTTYTHDTKRSEDTRSRLHVLSEIPEEWKQALQRWHVLNQKNRNHPPTPDRNEEYLIYQTLIGTWPSQEMSSFERERYLFRIDRYMKKAIKEAKIHTSWVDPDDRHEKDLHLFLHEILNPRTSQDFLNDFQAFTAPVQKAGMWNALSQLILKAACPGIPDFYQGSELWDFRLVDPDNRNPIDFAPRLDMLRELKKRAQEDPLDLMRSCVQEMENGKIKMVFTFQLLSLRQNKRDLFLKGQYIPLTIAGDRQEHWVAFAREWQGEVAIVIASRFFMGLFDPSFTQIEPGRRMLHWPEMAERREGRELFTGKKCSFQEEQISLEYLIEPWMPMAVWVLESSA